MNLRALGRRGFVSAGSALLSAGLLIPLLGAAPASAATTHSARPAHVTSATHRQQLSGTTTVTTAPGIASALLGAGVVPLPTPGTRLSIASLSKLTVSYGFPITGGNPDLAGPSGDINHSGGINFVSRAAHLEIGRFDIDLAAGTIFARQVNFAAGRIPVLDVDLSHLAVSTVGRRTVLSGITLRLDPVAAHALNATFGLALPADGSLVFGYARVAINN
jgi:hypothetical protein